MKIWMTALLAFVSLTVADPGSKTVHLYGTDCIQLKNDSTRVVLCPSVGGRILEYSLNGKQALPLPAANSDKAPHPAGRFDIGPELTIAKRPGLWAGEWTGKITGPRSATLVSPVSESTGVQLIREFTLAADSTRLSCKQRIKNISNVPVEYCHWSRTFAQGKGIVYLPLSEPSRFPNQYVMYESGGVINMTPEDPNIRVRDGFIEILAAPAKAKLGFDSYAGWMAYHMPNDLQFFKSYPAYPDRVYNEAAGLTASIWYPDHMEVVELEPIGPRERIAPGEQASFTETWYLREAPFPANPDSVNLEALTATATLLMK